MTYISITEAKEKLPELVGLIATEQEEDVTITINGKPTAKIIRCNPPRKRRMGIADGKFTIPDNWDELEYLS